MAKVALTPEHTQVQLCQWVWVEHAIEVGATTMGKTLAWLGLTRKKRRCMLPSKSEATPGRRVRTELLDKLGRPLSG